MKKSLIILFLFMVAIVAFSVAQDEKITVTTSSPKAGELYNQALNVLQNAEIDSAKHLLNEALTEDPDFFMANARLAFNGLFANNQEEFKSYAEKAINTKSDLSEGELFIKNALSKLNEDPKADVTAMGKKLVESYPKDETAYYVQAMFQGMVKDYQANIKTYNDLLKVTDNPAPVYNMMGYTYLNMGDMAAAQKSFDKYIELVPNHPNPYDSKGDYYMKAKDYANAYSSYIKANEMDKDWSYDKAMEAKSLMEKTAISESPDDK